MNWENESYIFKLIIYYYTCLVLGKVLSYILTETF